MRSEPDCRLAIRRVLEARRSEGRPRHLFIGIGGGSASGKSTIARDMARRLEPLSVEVMCQDRFFLPREDLPRYPSRLREEPWPSIHACPCGAPRH